MTAEPGWWINRGRLIGLRNRGESTGINMEFLAGSTAAEDKAAPAALFLTEASSRGESRIGLRRCVKPRLDELSESSSSVGVSGESSENEEEDDGAVSSQGRWLDSFGSSLEDSLPIKRGLSNHYIGKSKSFGNLMEASNAKDLEKVESPLNKRRRLLIANKLRRRSSLSSFSIYSKTNLHSMPLLALQESDEDDHKYNYDKDYNDDDDDSSDEEIDKLQEKDDEIVRIRNLNWVLQERVKSLYVENQIWRDIAQTNEAHANNLRTNLDQVLAQIETLPTAATAVEDDAESSCGSCVEGGEAITAVGSGCKRCGEREASVLVLPCRHLCLCTVCGSALLRTCPVCDSVMNASVHVNMSS